MCRVKVQRDDLLKAFVCLGFKSLEYSPAFRNQGWPDQNPNFLRNFCLLDIGLEKKVPQACPKIQGGGVKAVQQKSKDNLLF